MTMPKQLSRRSLLSLSTTTVALLSCTKLGYAASDGTVPEPLLTPQHHGAVADGVTDDSPAISRWMDYLIENALTGYVPAGDYLLGSMIEKKLTGVTRMGIIGDGSHVSRFIVPDSNPDGGFSIDGFNSRRHQFLLEHFSLLVTGAARIGFRLVLPEGGSQHQRSLRMTDVWARSANMTSDHFKVAFDFTGCWRPRLQDCGWDGPFVRVADEDDSPRFSCDTGFVLDGCYGLTVEDCYAWGCKTGISSKQFLGQITDFAPNDAGGVRVTLANGPMPFSKNAKVLITDSTRYSGKYMITPVSRTSFDIDTEFTGTDTGVSSLALGPEGMTFKDNVINGVINGIWVSRPSGREPTCWINGNHVNFRNYGIILDGVKIIQADQNNTYNEDIDNSFQGDPIDLDLRNASEYIIGSHVFHFGGHTRRVGIHVSSDTAGEGDNGLINNCIFSGGFETAIHLTKNVSGVRVGPNLYPGKIGTRVRDDNGTNVVI